jgi:flagellar L-ring protein precursor FlgH
MVEMEPLLEEHPLPVAEKPKTSASLWTDSHGSLFEDIKARRVGDIVTVAIYESASASKEASTSTGRSSSASADITKFFGLETDIANINKSIDPASLIKAGYKSDFEGSGSTSRKENLIATLTAVVVEVYSNGTMKIEGKKKVTVNSEKQIIRLTGIVRSRDISPQNIIDSKYILDADIAYTGKGVVSDKQRQGWLVRILDNVWMF